MGKVGWLRGETEFFLVNVTRNLPAIPGTLEGRIGNSCRAGYAAVNRPRGTWHLESQTCTAAITDGENGAWLIGRLCETESAARYENRANVLQFTQPPVCARRPEPPARPQTSRNRLPPYRFYLNWRCRVKGASRVWSAPAIDPAPIENSSSPVTPAIVKKGRSMLREDRESGAGNVVGASHFAWWTGKMAAPGYEHVRIAFKPHDRVKSSRWHVELSEKISLRTRAAVPSSLIFDFVAVHL